MRPASERFAVLRLALAGIFAAVLGAAPAGAACTVSNAALTVSDAQYPGAPTVVLTAKVTSDTGCRLFATLRSDPDLAPATAVDLDGLRLTPRLLTRGVTTTTGVYGQSNTVAAGTNLTVSMTWRVTPSTITGTPYGAGARSASYVILFAPRGPDAADAPIDEADFVAGMTDRLTWSWNLYVPPTVKVSTSIAGCRNTNAGATASDVVFRQLNVSTSKASCTYVIYKGTSPAVVTFHSENGGRLVNTANPASWAAYSLRTGPYGSNTTTEVFRGYDGAPNGDGTMPLSIPAGTLLNSLEFYVVRTSTPLLAGDYRDTLTITVSSN